MVKALPSGSAVTVKFFVTLPENTPMEDQIVIAGNFGSGKPTWNPGDPWGVATRVSTTQATFEIVYEEITEEFAIEYKWTRGDWGTVEKSKENGELTTAE